ncbi:MAG: glycosyl hydrolase family 35, partial [Anaerolineales bacterium]
LGGIPTLIGEFGIPFDLAGGRAFRSGDFSAQTAALDRSFRAIEANLLGCTLWNYTADNTNARGDQWNGEDLSIFSRDQQTDPSDIDSGGRAIEAAVRPYPIATAGEPLDLTFDRKRRRFRYTFRHDPAVEAATEIFVPGLHYANAPHIRVSDGTYTFDPDGQILQYWHDPSYECHTIQFDPDR